MEFYVQVQRKNRNQKSQKTKQMLKIYWIGLHRGIDVLYTLTWCAINILVK